MILNSVNTWVPIIMDFEMKPTLERIGICSGENSFLQSFKNMTDEELTVLYKKIDTVKTLTEKQVKIVKKAIFIYKAIKRK